MRIETTGGGMNYYTYKQGYWYSKGGNESDKDWKEVELTDKDKKTYKDSGVYLSALGGIVTDISINDIEHEGRKFSMLEVVLDNEDKLSMSFPSEASRKVLQQFENVDFSKRVIMTAWQKDGWAKLNIKQDNEHVKNSFMNWNADKKEMEYLGGYPVRPASSASERDKANFALDEKDFLRALVPKIKALVPEFEAKSLDQANSDNQIAYKEEILGAGDYDMEDINPEDIPF